MERVLEPEAMEGAAEAAAYDAMDHREPNAAFVGRLGDLGVSGLMLDIGTGPGHIPLLICERNASARVIGLDCSKAMLAIAVKHLERSRLRSRVSYLIGDAKRLPFADGAFDAVFSNTILHHLPEPADLLREAWRVVKPGGAFLIRDLFRPKDAATVEALVEQHCVGATAHQRGLFRDSLHAALTPGELRALVNAVGLTGAEVVIDTDRHMSLQKRAGRT
jgi:ubiquinone/menaquinone biosynthesis C-methylase UbiE